MVIASTLSTIEGLIPYLILAGVVIFIVLRLVVGPLIDSFGRARTRKDE